MKVQINARESHISDLLKTFGVVTLIADDENSVSKVARKKHAFSAATSKIKEAKNNGKAYQPKDDKIIRTMSKRKATDHEIGVTLGRTRCSIGGRRTALGISKRKKHH